MPTPLPRRNALFLGALLAACLGAALPAGRAEAAPKKKESPPMLSIAVHGGAGVLPRADITPEKAAMYAAALETARDAGYAVLERGGTAMDAVEAAVRVLEDNELFNAGRGAVFDWDGRNSLDAAFMDGRSGAAGAVAGVQHIKNPISLARRVMEASPHVLLTGEGAEEFALEQGIQLVPRSYFFTKQRWEQLQRSRKGDRLAMTTIDYFGTVGAVAHDAQGNLAAATSTGGMTAKRWGRVGDTPLIGAGTFADNAACAVSATGHGEYFIRNVVAHEICALVKYKGLTLAQAVHELVQVRLKSQGGDGGLIAVGKDGELVLDFNSDGMFRAARDSRGRKEVAIYPELYVAPATPAVAPASN
jgi:L-asparaginase / beta-aspartyl-peptidase